MYKMHLNDHHIYLHNKSYKIPANHNLTALIKLIQSESVRKDVFDVKKSAVQIFKKNFLMYNYGSNEILANHIYFYSKDLFSDICKELTEHLYGTMPTKKLWNNLEHFEYFIQTIVCTYHLVNKMKQKGHLQSLDIFEIAHFMQRARSREDFEKLNSDEELAHFEKLKDLLPKVVLNLYFATKVCIKNTHDTTNYLYPDTYYSFDGIRRGVFCWVPKDGSQSENWVIEKVGFEKYDHFYLKNFEYDEYLYADTDRSKFDSKRRRVFTWHPKKQLDFGEWQVELVNGTNKVYLKNAKYKEYLQAETKSHNDNNKKRQVFTVKTKSAHMRWYIEDCSYSSKVGKRSPSIDFHPNDEKTKVSFKKSDDSKYFEMTEDFFSRQQSKGASPIDIDLDFSDFNEHPVSKKNLSKKITGKSSRASSKLPGKIYQLEQKSHFQEINDLKNDTLFHKIGHLRDDFFNWLYPQNFLPHNASGSLSSPTDNLNASSLLLLLDLLLRKRSRTRYTAFPDKSISFQEAQGLALSITEKMEKVLIQVSKKCNSSVHYHDLYDLYIQLTNLIKQNQLSKVPNILFETIVEVCPQIKQNAELLNDLEEDIEKLIEDTFVDVMAIQNEIPKV